MLDPRRSAARTRATMAPSPSVLTAPAAATSASRLRRPSCGARRETRPRRRVMAGGGAKQANTKVHRGRVVRPSASTIPPNRGRLELSLRSLARSPVGDAQVKRPSTTGSQPSRHLYAPNYLFSDIKRTTTSLIVYLVSTVRRVDPRTNPAPRAAQQQSGSARGCHRHTSRSVHLSPLWRAS